MFHAFFATAFTAFESIIQKKIASYSVLALLP